MPPCAPAAADWVPTVGRHVEVLVGLVEGATKHGRTGCASGLGCQYEASARPQGKLRVDVGFWAGLVPANARDPAALRALLDGGALGFKAFLCPSGAAPCL